MLGITSQGISNVSDVNQIIDREKQRKLFIEVLERMCAGMPYPHNLFEYFGAPGIGKTTLVTLLQNECEQNGTPSVRLDFNAFGDQEKEGFYTNPLKVIDIIAASLHRYGVKVEELRSQIAAFSKMELPAEGVCLAYVRLSEKDRLYADVAWLESMRSITLAFAQVVDQLTSSDHKGKFCPLVLFIDSLENIPELLADWLEEFIVKPLVQSKRCIVVWTARHSWKWKRPELRWDRKSEELLPFTENEIKELLQLSPRVRDEQNLAEQLFKNVYSLTGGHPFAGAVVVQQIATWEDVDTLSLKQHEFELRSKINEHVIQNHAFKDLTLEQRTALELCAMVRLIDTTTLQHILQECVGGKYLKWEWQKFDQLIYDLRRTYLIKWGSSGWILEPSLRHLMRSYYLACVPETFEKVNRTVLKVYQDWLSMPVDNRKLFIIEELYHRISLQQAQSQKEDLSGILNTRLDEYSSHMKENTEAWRITLEQLEGDFEHDDELIQMLGDTAFQQLISPIKNRLKSLAGM